MKTRRKKTHLLPVLLLTLALVGLLAGMRRHEALRELPASLQTLYDRNPEARQFVLDYPKREADPLIDLSAEVTPGEAPLLLQWDERWGYRSYNDDFMACTGCGPTCLSMAVIGLTGDASCSPWAAAQYAEQNGYNVPGSGTAWNYIPAAAQRYGLSAEAIRLTEGTVLAELNAGHLIICVVGPGDFTTSGHFLLLTGTEDGMIRLNDPNSPKRSSQLWDYDRLAGQIEALWTVY